MSEWQPIETAPKDGTKVLVFRDGKVLPAFWGELVRGYFVWMMKAGPRDDDAVHCLGPEHDIDGNRDRFHHPGPTHWMPLPEPPK